MQIKTRIKAMKDDQPARVEGDAAYSPHTLATAVKTSLKTRNQTSFRDFLVPFSGGNSTTR